MHRRSLTACLADIPGARTALYTPRNVSVRHISNHKRKTKSQPPEAEVLKNVETLMKAAGHGDKKVGWKHYKEKGGEERRLSAAVQKAKKSPLRSPEQAVFTIQEEDQSVESPDEVIAKKDILEPGDFVEIRRNNAGAHGVILGKTLERGRTYYITLTAQGEIWPHHSNDVMFYMPKFADPDLVDRSGITEAPETPHEVTARVRILKKVRDYEKLVETEYISLAAKMLDIYETFRSPDPHQWSQVTAAQVARIKTDKRVIPSVTHLAVQKHLMRKAIEFVADPSDFLSTGIFSVRPKAHVETLNAVNDIMLHKVDVLDGFIAKAREIVEASRARAKVSRSAPPSIQPSRHQFTKDEISIITLMEQSVRTYRSIQPDPYIVPTSMIMRKLALYDGTVGMQMVNQFLVDLGIITPWDDPPSREWHRVISDPGRHVGQLAPQLSSRTASSMQPLGPNDLYPQDIAESIRHDFGDMPVYVIDDVGAEELDDGLSLERIPSEPRRYWVHIHIADPTSVLPPGHTLAAQARRQLETRYCIQGTLPMLPNSFVHDGLSLGAPVGSDKRQRVLTFSVKLDEDGTLLDYQVRAGIIRNIRTLKYDDVDAALGLPPVHVDYPFGRSSEVIPPEPIAPEIVEDLRILEAISRGLVEQRLRTDTLLFTSASADVKFNTKPVPTIPIDPSRPSIFEGFPSISYVVTNFARLDTGARRAVSELMKVACRVASIFLRDHKVAVIRRGGHPLRTATYEDFQDLLNSRDDKGYIDIFDAMRKGAAIPRAEYTLRPAAHWQLGVPEGEGYVRVTSPLRRFGDLASHWQIKHALLAEASQPAPPAFSEDSLIELAKEMEYKESRMKNLNRAHHAYWAMTFLERWHDYPEDHADMEDPLQNLVALPLREVSWNVITRTAECKVHIPALGLQAVVVGMPYGTILEIGKPVNVKWLEVHKGLTPSFSVKLK